MLSREARKSREVQIVPPFSGEMSRARQGEVTQTGPSDLNPKPGETEITRPIPTEVSKPTFPPPSPPVIPLQGQQSTSLSSSKDLETNSTQPSMAKSPAHDPAIPKPQSAKAPPASKSDPTAVNMKTEGIFERRRVAYYPSVMHTLAKTEGETGPSKTGALLAEEAEIKQFLLNYREKYIGRDVAAFLQLFSSRALQNQKQGIDDIRAIYETFFGQSQDLRYHIEEIVFEIYQNAIEVKARYTVDQTLKKGGEKKLWNGPIRWVFVKEDGALKILRLDYQNVK
jgi:ketosteroid isomerase-like protein